MRHLSQYASAAYSYPDTPVPVAEQAGQAGEVNGTASTAAAPPSWSNTGNYVGRLGGAHPYRPWTMRWGIHAGVTSSAAAGVFLIAAAAIGGVAIVCIAVALLRGRRRARRWQEHVGRHLEQQARREQSVGAGGAGREAVQAGCVPGARPAPEMRILRNVLSVVDTQVARRGLRGRSGGRAAHPRRSRWWLCSRTT